MGRKWNVAALMPAPLADTRVALQKSAGRKKPKTLRQACINQLALADPHALGKTLCELGGLPHLQEQLIKSIAIEPKKSRGAAHLRQWVSHRRLTLKHYANELMRDCPRDPLTVGPRDEVKREAALHVLQTAVEKTEAEMYRLEEEDAKRFERIEDSWHNHVDGRRAQRYFALLEKLNW